MNVQTVQKAIDCAGCGETPQTSQVLSSSEYGCPCADEFRLLAQLVVPAFVTLFAYWS